MEAPSSSGGLSFEPRSAREQEDVKAVNTKLGVSTLTELRALPAQKLLEAFAAPQSKGFDFGPDVDGYFLSEPVPAIFAAGKQNDVPLLAGWNHDEGSFEVIASPQKPTADRLKATAQKEFGETAPEFLRLYPSDTNEHALRSAADFAGDRFIAFSSWEWMESQAKTGKQPIYRYRFDLGPPSHPKGPPMGAYHSSEIEYVFGQLDSKLGCRGDRRTVSSVPRWRKIGQTSRAAAIPTAPACRRGRGIQQRRAGP